MSQFTKEFHIFVFVTTVIYFLLLKRYKKDITENALSKQKEPSNLVYLVFLPIILYTGHLFFNSKLLNTKSHNTSIIQPTYNAYKPLSSDGLLSIPYPASSN